MKSIIKIRNKKKNSLPPKFNILLTQPTPLDIILCVCKDRLYIYSFVYMYANIYIYINLLHSRLTTAT